MRKVAMVLLACGMLIGSSAYAGGAGDGKPAAPASSGGAATAAPKTAPPAPANAAPAPAASPAVEREIQQLRDLLESQQAALKSQQDQIQALQAQLSASRDTSSATVSHTSEASSGFETPALTAAATPSGSSTMQENEKSPLSFKIGSASFTPGGFVDFTSYYRTTNTGSGIGTGFNTIPFNNDTSGKGGQSETRFSAQNSRVTLKVDAPLEGGKMLGYLEADFLGNAPSNLNVTSNSNTMRMRVYFADYTRGKWEMLGGQDWSMLTPGKKGISPMPSDIFYTQDMDTNYQAGLVWARQAQFRLVYHASDSWTMGLSLENPDQYTGPFVTFPTCFTGSSPCFNQTNQVDTGSGTSSPGLHPDFIVKVAHDHMIGEKNLHIEAAGLLTSAKLVTPTSSNSSNSATESRTGGGVSLNLNLQLTQNFRFIANSFWSDGAGRYIGGLGPNFIVNQDANSLNFFPTLIHSGSAMGGFEWQVRKKSLLYGYYSAVYYGRASGIDPLTGQPIGYGYGATLNAQKGFLGSSSSDNRTIQEGTIGVIQTLWKNPNYGAFEIITQASYLSRAPWFVSVDPITGISNPKNAHLVMGYADLRYVLP